MPHGKRKCSNCSALSYSFSKQCTSCGVVFGKKIVVSQLIQEPQMVMLWAQVVVGLVVPRPRMGFLLVVEEE